MVKRMAVERIDETQASKGNIKLFNIMETSRLVPEFIDVDGVETHVLKFGSLQDFSPLQSEQCEKRTMFLVIPVLHGSTPLNFGHFSYHLEGNPGIPEYYEEFMHTLWEKSGEKIPVWCVSHAGHVSGPVSRILGWTEIVRHPKEQYTLELQIKHKVTFIKENIPADVRLILIGHSIGCYMILNLLPHIPEFQVLRCFMLFPTIERMAESPNGRIVTPIFNYFRWIFVGCIKILSYLSPSAKLKMIRFHFRNDCVPECALKATLNLLDPTCVHHSTLLAKQEMAEVVELQSDLLKQYIDKMSFYYGSADRWCPKEYCYSIRMKFPDADIRLCQMDFSHAFVLDSGEEMAYTVWDWVVEHL